MSAIVANLDCESRWAGAHLPKPILAAISRAALLLDALASPGDAIYLPARPKTEDIVGLDLVATLHVGHPQTTQGIAWANTDETAKLVAPGRDDPLFRIKGSDPSLSRTVNDKRFAFELARQDGMNLAGSRLVGSREELVQAVAQMDAAARWVLKAPFSASGRDRIIRCGLPDERIWRYIDKLFKRFGELIFEPWMDREGDFGIVGFVDDTQIQCTGMHGIEMTALGAVTALRTATELDHADKRAIETSFERAGLALRAAGYRGPFGVDAFRYRDQHGRVGLQTQSEINARMTFGLVAQYAAQRRGQAIRMTLDPPRITPLTNAPA